MNRTLAILGPGLLFAATSVGTSHLVQSTRAGALYGLALVGIVLFANALKYPAFRFASDYFPATGNSLLEGYRQQGKGVLLFFTLVTLTTLLFGSSALALMTAGLLSTVLSLEVNDRVLAVAILVVTSLILVLGHYRTLERMTKVLVGVMAICTVIATALVLPRLPVSDTLSLMPQSLDLTGWLFLAALIGWMPVPLDAAVWQSLWSRAKADNSQQPPSADEVRFDFNLGYFSTVFLALCFLAMGAGLIYGQGIELETGSAGFSAQLIALYAQVFGSWVAPVVGIAAIAIIYSSLLSLMDAFPRTLTALARRWQDIDESTDPEIHISESSFPYISVLILMVLGGVVTYTFFLTSLHALIDLGAITAFIAAPAIAWFNHRAMTSAAVPAEYRPSMALQRYSLVSVLVMGLLSLAYLVLRFLV